MEDFQIDNIDLKILGYLSRNATTPYTEIAKKLLVSSGTIHVRMRKMEKAGVVKGSSIIVDPAKLGFDLTAFIGVFLDKGSNYKTVIREFNRIPEITEAYYTTGNYSIFIKIICRNTSHLRDVLNDKIQPISGVQRTETILSLEQSIGRTVDLG